MGFFSWLFGKYKDIPVEDNESVTNNVKENVQQAENLNQRKVYKKVPRTKEVSSFVDSVLKKAENPDLKPSPYKESVDSEQVSKFVDKLQGRKR